MKTLREKIEELMLLVEKYGDVTCYATAQDLVKEHNKTIHQVFAIIDKQTTGNVAGELEHEQMKLTIQEQATEIKRLGEIVMALQKENTRLIEDTDDLGSLVMKTEAYSAERIVGLIKQRDELARLLRKHYVKYQVSFLAADYYYCPVCRARYSTVDVKCKPNCPIKLALDATEEGDGQEKEKL